MKILFALFCTIFFFSGPNKIEVKNAWLRPADTGMNSALYLKIVNNSAKADTLYKVGFSDASMAMMHETYKKGDLTGMKMVKEIAVNPNSTFQFKPGYYHIMLIKLKKDLKPKEKENFELYFKSGRKIKGTAIVSQN
jgi:periplasmic copper chaperone A